MGRQFIANVKGVGVKSIKKEYCTSTSSSVAGDDWVDSVPSLEGSLYLWSRWKVILTNGTTTVTEAMQEGVAGDEFASLEQAVSKLVEDFNVLDNSLGKVATKDVVPVSMGGTGVTTLGEIALMAYPVGAVYISYESTSPAEMFGGTWTPITGVFPYFNAGTGTGGSNTHTLTVAEMPSHNHSGYLRITTDKLGGGSTYARLNDNGASQTPIVVNNTGGGQPHNNMPAYQEFYAWRRIA